jgi:hypothetical protein
VLFAYAQVYRRVQRVKFDVASSSYRKLNTPLRFDAEVFMDRYFLEQREPTTQVRRVVTQWRSDLSVLDRNIKAITNFKVPPASTCAAVLPMSRYQR